MRAPTNWATGSKVLINTLIAGVVMLSSLLMSAPALAATTHTVCSSGCSFTDLQAAAAAAAAGDTIVLNENQTVTSKVSLTKQLTIQAGSANVINTSGSDFVFELTGAAAGSTINGLTFIKSDTTNQKIITVQANNATVSNNIFSGTYALGDNQVNRAIEVSTVSNLLVSGNEVSGFRQPAYINNGSSGTVSNNFTEGSRGWVVEGGSNIAFSGNSWGTNEISGPNQRNAIDIAIIPGSPDNVTNNYPSIVAMSNANNDAKIQNQLSGTFSDVYVDDSAAPAGNGYWQTPFTTVTAGVNAIAVGGTVYVAEGTYTESTVNINKAGVILLGAQAGVDANGGRTHGSFNDESYIVGSVTYTASFAVNASDVVIDGFDFGPLTNGVSSGPVGVDLGNSNGAVVVNSIFEHNQRGISLNGASDVFIANVRVADNNSNPENNAGIWGDNVNGITIQDSEFYGASNTAINLAGSSNIEILDNLFEGNGNTAVIWNDSNVLFDGNTGRDFNGSGLFVTASTNVTVSNNNLSDGAGFSGVSLSSAGGASTNVKILSNTITGFNRAVNVGVGGLTDVLTVTSNNLSGNTTSGVSAPLNAANVVNAVSNWWGSATGPNDNVSSDGSTPDNNPLGTGSAAIGAVNYSNWCVNVTCTTPAPTTPGGGAGTGGGSTLGATVTVSSTQTTGSSNSGDGTGNDDGTADDSEVLGADASILSTSTDAGSDDKDVKGVTDKDKKVQESSNFLGLGWWWIPLIVAAILLFLAWLRRRNQDTTA